MFYIQGIGGQVFHGSLEQLAQVRGIAGAHPSRGINREGEEEGNSFTLTLKRQEGESDNRDDRVSQAAAYTEMLQQDTERDPVRHAFQIMSKDVMSLRADDSVETAWRSLTTHQVRQAPVLNETQNVIGLVNERELLTILDLQNGRAIGPLDRPIREVMTTPVVCAEPASDIRRIVRVLLDTRQSALPVVSESGLLVGIVSRGDILRAALLDPPLSLWV